MQPRVGYQMLSQIVGSGIHESDSIQCTAAQMGTCGCVRAAAREGELDLAGSEHPAVVRQILIPWMPGKGSIDILEQACTRHVGFAAAPLLSRTAVITNGSRYAALLQIMPDRNRRAQRACA
ncbi:hypothetical protein D3C73_1171970 [compost metagenome]